jgi:hypothetical protein
VPTIPPGIDRYLYFLYNYRFRHGPAPGSTSLMVWPLPWNRRHVLVRYGSQRRGAAAWSGTRRRRAPAAVDPSCRSSPAKRTRKAVLARHGAASRRRLVGEAVHLTCCVRPRRPHLPLPDSSLTLWTASSPRSTVVATDPNNLLACCRAPTAKAGELPNVSDQGLDMTPPPVRIPLPTKGVASLVCKA